MNANPHTHRLDIRRDYSDGTGTWIINYGDTRVKMWNWVPRNKEKALRRKALRCVKKHDRGTQRAARRYTSTAAITTALNSHFVLKDSTGYAAPVAGWGSDILKQKQNV